MAGKPAAIRPIRVDGDIAFVALTQGREAMIDVVDIPIVETANWNLFTPNGRANIYAERRERSDWGKRILLHRLIMGDPIEQVDHRDGNGLNCCRNNLRLATHSQNQMNRRGNQKNNTSGYKGVSWNNIAEQWTASIQANGKQTFLGRFASKELAYEAYCDAAKRLHGEFARF